MFELARKLPLLSEFKALLDLRTRHSQRFPAYSAHDI